VHSTVTRTGTTFGAATATKSVAAKGKKPRNKKSKTDAGTTACAATGTTSVNNIAGTGKTLAANTSVSAKTTAANTFVSAKTTANNSPGHFVPAASNATTKTTGTMRGGSHVVGDVALFVPRKSRTTGVKRSIDEVGNVGTQQSVNKN